MSAPTPTPTPGISAPLASISRTNEGGLIAVMTALSLTFVLVAFGIRGYIRYSNGPWRRDDHIFTALTILACIQSAVVFFEVGKGLGKVDGLVSAHDLAQTQKAYFANNVLYILTLFLTKCSVAFLYLRLSPVRLHKMAVSAILALASIWAVMSILLVTIDCPWESGCSNMFQRWQAVGSLDIITDVAFFLISVLLVKDLQMSWTPKAIVVAAFGTRLLVVAPCALRLHYLNPSVLPTEHNIALSLVVVCTQLQIGYGAMAATFPCLRPFVAVYEAPVETKQSSYYRHGSHSDVKLTSVNSGTTRSKSGRRSRNRSPEPRAGRPAWDTAAFRPDQSTHTATVSFYNKHQGANSVNSQESQKMFIERKVDYSVTYDDRSMKEDARSSADGHV